jgi:hypothetical protein
MIKSMILKVVGKKQKQSQPRVNIFNTPINFRTVEPDVKLSFDKWSKKFKVSSSFTLLEDSEWLQKIRKTNHIKHVENNQQVIYLIKNPWE